MQDIRVGGRMSKAQFQYALQSADLEELNHWSHALVDKLREIPLLHDVTSDQQTRGLQTNVVVDRDAAARLGVSPAAIDNTLYDAFGQRQVSTLYTRLQPAPRHARSRPGVSARTFVARQDLREIDERPAGAALEQLAQI